LNIQKELHFRENVKTFIQAKEISNERKYQEIQEKYLEKNLVKYFSCRGLPVNIELSMGKISMTISIW